MDKTPQKIIRVPPEIVDVTGLIEIIDQPRFQLLDGKRQTGLLYKIYKGANHTRFEHSIGTLGVMNKIVDHLEFEGELKQALRVFALLHDIGHLPFSHNIEPLIGSHEKSEILDEFKGVISDVTDFGLVKKLFEKEDPHHPLVTHKILGADKLDYLFRDAYHIGREGCPDTANLIEYLVFHNNKVMSEEKNAGEIMRTQNLYYDLHTFFYYIKQYLINQRILQRAVEESIGIDFQEEELHKMKDSDLESRLASSENKQVRELYDRIRFRGDTLKSVVVFRLDGFEKEERIAGKPIAVYPIAEEVKDKFLGKYKNNVKKLTELENELSGEFDIPRGRLLIATILDFERLAEPADVLLYSRNGSQESLFHRYPYHKETLKQKANLNFSIRVVTTEELRPVLFKKAEGIRDYMLHSMQK